MDNIVIQDVLEVLVKEKNKKNPKYYYLGLASKSDVAQTVKQDPLRGGIGNSRIGILQSDKELKFGVSTVLHNDSIYEIQSGEKFLSREVEVNKNVEAEFISKECALKLEDIKTGVTDVLVIDRFGKTYKGTYTATQGSEKIAVTSEMEDGYCTIIYTSLVKDAEVLDINSKKFPKNHEVELHTIAYDVDTNEVIADIYWQFEKCLPDGNFTANYEAGKNSGSDIKFAVQKPVGKDNYGRYIVIKRK